MNSGDEFSRADSADAAMLCMTALRMTPVSPALGVVIEGLDLAAELPDKVWDELRGLAREHLLLVFPGQYLSDAQHRAAAAHFGPIASEGLKEKHDVGFVSNARADGLLGVEAASWHIDYGFFPEPYHFLSLYGIEIPPAGSETFFVNAILGASTLSRALRERVRGLSARQVLDPAAPGGSAGVRVRIGRLDNAVAHMERPVLWPHRDTGREILGVWEQQTDAVLPLSEAESRALIEDLYAHLYQPAHMYVHRWSEGDLVLWDNHAVQHARAPLDAGEARTLRRVCIGPTQDLSLFGGDIVTTMSTLMTP